MTILGTHYFVSEAAALRYYADYGETYSSVRRMMCDGDIALGEPPVLAGGRLVLIDGETRYGIELP